MDTPDIKKALADINRNMVTLLKNVWDVRDLALVLGVKADRIRHMVSDGVLPYYKQNGSLYFKRTEIEAWLTRNRTASKDEINSKADTYIALKKL